MERTLKEMRIRSFLYSRTKQKNIRACVAVEAGGELGWGKYVGLDGTTVTMSGFGASAPAGILQKKFGFTVENVVKAMKSVL